MRGAHPASPPHWPLLTFSTATTFYWLCCESLSVACTSMFALRELGEDATAYRESSNLARTPLVNELSTSTPNN